MVSANSTSDVTGNGTLKRSEQINMRVAATVSQALPNGNLVVVGRQQVRVNQELRDLQVGGIIRPQDIGSDNTVKHDRLAEARIAYGGRGTINQLGRKVGARQRLPSEWSIDYFSVDPEGERKWA